MRTEDVIDYSIRCLVAIVMAEASRAGFKARRLEKTPQRAVSGRGNSKSAVERRNVSLGTDKLEVHVDENGRHRHVAAALFGKN
jgi:hypothetical protein